MNSPPRSSREEERRLNIRTLIIASAASASAALATSRLWIAGTWIAAAMTPVIVALVSEILHRPTKRIARSITSNRPALTPDAAAPEPPGATAESAAAQRVAARLRGGAEPTRPLPDPEAPAPTRAYRSEPARRPPLIRRKFAYGVVLGTAALAFVIGALALTVPELITGGSLAGNDRRTTLGGGRTDGGDDRAPQQPVAPETPRREQEQPQPSTTPREEEQQPTTPETETETTPTETTAPGEPPTTETAPPPEQP